MKIVDHGIFTPYVPSEERQRELGVVAADPDLGNQGVLFTRSEEGRDFYDMEFDGVFSLRSILVSVNANGRIVGSSFAGTRVPPHKGCRLYELTGDDLPPRLEDVSGKIVDMAAGALVDPPPPLRTFLFKTEIYARMSDDELDLFDAGIEQAGTRMRLMWRDCTQVEADSPLFPLLMQQLAAAFGTARAGQILSLAP